MDNVPTTGNHSNSNPTRKIGEWAETAACEFLTGKGYRIVKRNFTFSKAEIDIIALKDKTLVFIEVKMRSRLDYGQPFDAVTPKKIRMVMLGINGFLLVNKDFKDFDQRLDVISIARINGEVTIDHFENITQMMSF